MQQGQLVPVVITDLTDEGDGVGRYEGLVVFVPGTVPGDRTLVRLIRVKPQYATGKLVELGQASPYRVDPSCIVADKCGGCQWQHIEYEYQLQTKRSLIIETLERIGGINQPNVNQVLSTTKDNFTTHKTLESTVNHQDFAESDTNKTYGVYNKQLGYRNKVTYPFGISATGKVQTGYYQKGTHKLINLNQCPVQDARLNPLLRSIKQDIQRRNWSIYNEEQHQGQLRHLSLRIGRRTGEMLLTLIACGGKGKSAEPEQFLPDLDRQAEMWLDRYPNLVGVCLNINPEKTNIIFGQETICISGQPYLEEVFSGVNLLLRPDTFFQVNTEVAEALLAEIITELGLQGNETIVDAYCGIGTFSLPLARYVKKVIGLEVQYQAVEQAEQNAELNDLKNVKFYAGTVESLLGEMVERPDIVLLDPPRQGCDRSVLDTLLKIQPQTIIYISCKPSTLARDLKILLATGQYQLTRVQPADFFPQTSHIECAAFLKKL